MAELLRALRAKGHQIELGEGLEVVVTLAAGADATKARSWCLDHEQVLRRELVAETQAAAGLGRVREVWEGSKVAEVRGPNGEPVKGAVRVVECSG